MTMPRFLTALVVIFSVVSVLGLACAPKPTETPTPTPSLPPAPTAPVLSSPANESTVSNLTVKLEWSVSAGVSSYGLQVATDSAFTKLVLEKTGITSTSYEVASGLNWKTDYYWRVNASNSSISSSWSEVRKFSTPIFKVDKIAFSSWRDGNAEIYVMNADGSNQTRLTNSTAHEDAPKWSPDGTRIAFSSMRDGNWEIYVMNADGSNQTRLTVNPAADVAVNWSPDGTKITFSSMRDGTFSSMYEGNWEIYIMNADGSNQTLLTNKLDNTPAWSSDGARIAFASRRDGNCEIYVMNADGSNQTRLTNNPAWDWIPAWSPDGSKIAFTSAEVGMESTNTDIIVMNSDGSNRMKLTQGPTHDAFTTWSPDGTKIVFHSNRDGNYDIYVMNADGSNQTRLTDNPARDSQPSWR